MQDRIKNNFGKLVFKSTFPGFGLRSYLMLVPPTKMFCFGMSKLFLSCQKNAACYHLGPGTLSAADEAPKWPEMEVARMYQAKAK